MKIQAVFFDFGGVIQRTEYQAPRQHLAERFGMDYADIDQIVFNSSSAVKATVGEISVEKHWESVAQCLKIKKEQVNEIEHSFFAGDLVDHSILSYLRTLRPRFQVGMISNAWSDMRVYLERTKIADVFDHLTISAEVGVAKPNEEIYQIALTTAHIQASEAVFVDDVQANIEASERLGMKGILFKNPNEAMLQLKKILGE